MVSQYCFQPPTQSDWASRRPLSVFQPGSSTHLPLREFTSQDDPPALENGSRWKRHCCAERAVKRDAVTISAPAKVASPSTVMHLPVRRLTSWMVPLVCSTGAHCWLETLSLHDHCWTCGKEELASWSRRSMHLPLHLLRIWYQSVSAPAG